MSGYSKVGEFVSFLNSLRVLWDIILLQETFLKSRHTFKIKGYQIERLDRQNDMACDGVLTCVREDLAYSSAITSQEPQCLSTTVITRLRMLNNIHFYVPPGRFFSRGELEKILSPRCHHLRGHERSFSNILRVFH